MALIVQIGDGTVYSEDSWRELHPPSGKAEPVISPEVLPSPIEKATAIAPRPFHSPSLGGKVGFFPTINGLFHIGHAYSYVAAGFLARKIGAKLHLNCTMGGECPPAFAARQVGLLTSLILPDEVVFVEADHKEKQLRLVPQSLLKHENNATKKALLGEGYEVRVDDRPDLPIKPLLFREKGTERWHEALGGPLGTSIEDIDQYFIQGVAFEYFIQRLYGVTLSIDGMDIARTMLPNWRALAKLLGEDGLYWDARFMPLLVDPITKSRLCTSMGDPVRMEHWALGNWIGKYGELGLLRLFWSWMQAPPAAGCRTALPGTVEELVEEFNLENFPWTTEVEELYIEIDYHHINFCEFGPRYDMLRATF